VVTNEVLGHEHVGFEDVFRVLAHSSLLASLVFEDGDGLPSKILMSTSYCGLSIHYLCRLEVDKQPQLSGLHRVEHD